MKKITVLLGMVFLMFVVINANYVFAKSPHQEIIQRLDTIQQTLDYLEGYCGVPKTGQTRSYVPRDDGDLQTGAAWPVLRLTDNGNGTVTDNLTRLVWMQNAECDGRKSWPDAVAFCNDLASGNCGLADGSVAGDWRLPNVLELFSLIDHGQNNPALPSGHTFLNYKPNFQVWSSTAHNNDMHYSWHVHFAVGRVNYSDKGNPNYLWCVRDGN